MFTADMLSDTNFQCAHWFFFHIHAHTEKNLKFHLALIFPPKSHWLAEYSELGGGPELLKQEILKKIYGT